MFVLDTNSLIYFFKGEGHVGGRLLRTPKSSDSAKRRRQLDTLLDVVNLLPFGAREARVAAGVRAKLEREGCPIA